MWRLRFVLLLPAFSQAHFTKNGPKNLRSPNCCRHYLMLAFCKIVERLILTLVLTAVFQTTRKSWFFWPPTRKSTIDNIKSESSWTPGCLFPVGFVFTVLLFILITNKIHPNFCIELQTRSTKPKRATSKCFCMQY